MRRKIAILGGGVGGLSTAFQLTHPDNPQRDEVEVTVYQIGWRLGGKCATGRNQDPAYSQRIQEHGIHILFGFYDNAFRMIQECYGEVAPPPLPTWEDAFLGRSTVSLMQNTEDQGWIPWTTEIPVSSQVPGQGGLFDSPIAYIEILVEWLLEILEKFFEGLEAQGDPVPGGSEGDSLFDAVRGFVERGKVRVEQQSLHALLRLLCHLSRPLGKDTEELEGVMRSHERILRRLLGDAVLDSVTDRLETLVLRILAALSRLFLDGLWDLIGDDVEAGDLEATRLWLVFNYALANLIGYADDDLLIRGLDAANGQDYRAWLGQYAHPDEGRTVNSPLVSWLYDAVFAFRQGDFQKPNMEAGSALRALIRLVLTYKGHFYYKFAAGTADTLMAPLYTLLKKRGVRFRFFHRIENLGLSADRKSVATIQLRQQVVLRNGTEEYEPLQEIKGLGCWPDRPLFAQIEHGDVLRQSDVDLESYSSSWKFEGPRKTLKQGEDFDTVVLAVSLASIPCLCPELVAADPRWQAMVEGIGTTRTQGFQIWLRNTLAETGWQGPDPVLTSYDITPLDSWTNLTEVLRWETWPTEGEGAPRQIAYYCGPLKEIEGDAPCNPVDGKQQARECALDYLRRWLPPIWPDAVDQNGVLQWDLLIDNRPRPGVGEERFDAQFWISIANPSDRYVQTFQNTSKLRLKADASGFANLVLAGDWTDNTFNIGCVEATVMSGMAASNALTAYPPLDAIVGWDFGAPKDS